ncbi:FKBP-type peptidyl-prolyl cis-trans isomerase domain - like 10 [Theobroma cacao]|nr:FKBP-type peptidyl-prolyl cis-trans isomerase domain - like 10 [Theobroma cacao]
MNDLAGLPVGLLKPLATRSIAFSVARTAPRLWPVTEFASSAQSKPVMLPLHETRISLLPRTTFLSSVSTATNPTYSEALVVGHPFHCKSGLRLKWCEGKCYLREQDYRWDEGVMGMQVGEVARLRCSPDYAYGAGGFPAWGIQPNSVLDFEIEVLTLH